MLEPTLRQLRTFLAVVETGGISAAARTLHLTQPAASQQLRELERVLRVRLLQRAGGKVQPTASGEALLEPARRIRDAVRDAVTVTAAHRAGEVGHLRLGTGATAAIYLLPPVLAEAKRCMPGLEITIATGNSSDMSRKVETGELDIALITLPLAQTRSVSVSRLMADPLLALIPTTMASPDPSVTAEYLAGLPLILYEPAGSTRVIIDGWFRRSGFAPSPIMQLDSIETIKVLVSGGLGASIMPRLALGSPVEGAVVKQLHPAISRQLGIVLHRRKTVDRGLRILTDVLRAVCARTVPDGDLIPL